MKRRFCPMCGSEDVRMEAGGVSGIYICNKCKFRGAIFPEIDDKKTNQLRKIGREVKICPKCKSENVYMTTKFIKSPVRFLAPHLGTHVCRDCGFEAFIFPAKIKKEKKRKLLRRKK